jgi:Mrp family chromosome partitioning ATPase
LNASELLGSKSMNRLIQEAKQHFAVILLDSPPILPVTDATVLATMVDAVVMVVRAGKTQTQGLKQSIELLKGVQAQLLGGIITGVPDDRSDYASRYHHHKQRETS